MPNPSRSRDRLDDDQMTVEVHRRWGGELVPLVAVHGRLSYFNFDGFSHLSSVLGYFVVFVLTVFSHSC